jgi:hypothetical protein
MSSAHSMAHEQLWTLSCSDGSSRSGNGSASLGVELSLLSPRSCTTHWLAAVPRHPPPPSVPGTEGCTQASNIPAIILGAATALSVAAVIWLATLRRSNRNEEVTLRGKFLLRETNEPPSLPSLENGGEGDDLRYHIFVSHTWRTGQDQPALIKRLLTQYLPANTRIFLDVGVCRALLVLPTNCV